MSLKKAVAVLVMCLPFAAAAQDELGLDFSEAKTPPEFRPNIAFIGVTPEQAEDALAGRAKLLEAELGKMIAESERFGVVKMPVDAAGVSTTARKCLDFACLEGLAEKLGVHRIILATLAKAGPNTVLTINGFDPTLPAVLPLSIESSDKAEKAKLGGFAGIAGKSQGERDKEFLAKTRGPWSEMLKKIATPLGRIAIDVIEQGAVTMMRGKQLGTGSFVKPLPAASYDIEVTQDGYLPFTATVVIEPMKVADVKVTLVAKEIVRSEAPVTVTTEPAPVFYKRPGLYVALVGAILMGVGFSFGALAKGTENRAVDGDNDGIIDITRSQANTAKTQALLANVFVATGAVALAAGAVWAFVIPLIPRKSGGQAPVTPGDPEGSGFGFQAAFGGTF